MTTYRIFDFGGKQVGIVELYPVEEETENGTEIIYGVKRKCMFCNTEETEQWWKCCPTHTSGDGPGVVCDDCYNKPDHGSNVGAFQKFEDPVLCAFATDTHICVEVANHDGSHDMRVKKECGAKRAAAYGIDSTVCTYINGHDGPHSWVVT